MNMKTVEPIINVSRGNAVRTSNENMIQKKRAQRNANQQREKSIFCMAITLLLVLAFAWVLSGKIGASNVTASSSHDSYKYYTSVQVKQGDSLWSIASAHMIAECGDVEDYIDEIKELNHLDNDAIHAGEYLLVPYYSVEYL